MLADLIEGMVYDSKFDSSLKHAVKFRKTVTNILNDYQVIFWNAQKGRV